MDGKNSTPLQRKSDLEAARRVCFARVADNAVPTDSLSPATKDQLVKEASAPAVPKAWETHVSMVAADIWAEASAADDIAMGMCASCDRLATVSSYWLNHLAISNSASFLVKR